MINVQKVGFQGECGAYSHIACHEVFPGCQAVPCLTFEDAFEAVETGDVDVAILPIENSIVGRVPDIHHLLRTSGLQIIAERFVSVRHQLMAARGATLNLIKSVESHSMALRQCRNVIRKWGLSPLAAANTAVAARKVAESGDRTRAAIASRLAAQIYDLEILAEDVDDESHNTTRFIALARESVWPSPGAAPLITTVVFRARNLPAALFKALGGFATNGVDMMKLESYMVGGEFVATEFYCDVEGHPESRNLMLALEELKFFSEELKILGVYPAHQTAAGGRNFWRNASLATKIPDRTACWYAAG
jgi:prephenate dehydratase